MRSRTEQRTGGRARAACAGVVALSMLFASAARADETAAPIAQARRVIDEMKADPALNGHRTTHQLRWKNQDRKPPPDSKTPGWLKQLAGWIAVAGRGVVWVLGAIAVAVVAVLAWRWARVRSDALRASAGLLPSFVNELDIRPESLPADIAGTARALVQRGETRAALSLLYRGALSRLVHDRQVPILGSSTEGECVQLAARALPSDGAAYFARLVAAWQTEVYAGRAVAGDRIVALCDEFDTHLAPLPDRTADAPQPIAEASAS